MAGKEERIAASASKPKVDGESGVCWRKEVDQNLKRLQSLLFGADAALEKRDFGSAQALSLALIGFLDSHSRCSVDEAFIRPIRREAVSRLGSARRASIPDSDRQAFAQAGIDIGCIFRKKGDVDIEKIKQSRYFRSLFSQSCETTAYGLRKEPDKQDHLMTSKTLVQAKLTSLYGTGSKESNRSFMKDKSSEDCAVIEKNYSSRNYQQSHSMSTITKAEEEEGACGVSFKTKRLHRESISPRIEIVKSPSCYEEADVDAPGKGFVTAKAKLEMEARQSRGLNGSPSASISPQSDAGTHRGYGAKSYGYSRRGVRGNFVPPIRSNGNNTGNMTSRISGKGEDAVDDSTKRCLELLCGPDGELPEKLRNLEPRLIEHVSNEIMDRDPNVRWNDIAGLEHAKKCVTEMVIWPLLRPDIFKGCRSPGRGLLLFGPPGTGKTMIGKAIAGEAKATFFYISASSLTSKWIGEGEKLVRALFGVASCRQPAVIFVDEIDSLLSQRKSEGEHESSRRLKTQFLIEMEGFDSGSEQILLIGATNRPQELDEAARRRLTKRLYIPLPTSEARAWIIKNLLEKDGLFNLSNEDIDSICKITDGYSGSDMKNLVKDASMGPLREALEHGIEITKLKEEDMRPVNLQDFEKSLQEVRPSVSLNELGTYEKWNEQFGSLSL
ncbi:P-loop containing nucleoside triphosphate hydrolases superfamily protein [Perilla frutescens var. hirtella]|uniref:P-loop containing nucleoside triphosphate hydrolases superfamily protein n=1 Tax=Perilla frutescens var. hirtella TaxID=608512 RepID=A0AAD4P237_PERFH|nr:P-loop containing nucleoside triphosphate hydrolases superfamily protein [Perilla frutescens var. hirtella]